MKTLHDVLNLAQTFLVRQIGLTKSASEDYENVITALRKLKKQTATEHDNTPKPKYDGDNTAYDSRKQQTRSTNRLVAMKVQSNQTHKQLKGHGVSTDPEAEPQTNAPRQQNMKQQHRALLSVLKQYRRLKTRCFHEQQSDEDLSAKDFIIAAERAGLCKRTDQLRSDELGHGLHSTYSAMEKFLDRHLTSKNLDSLLQANQLEDDHGEHHIRSLRHKHRTMMSFLRAKARMEAPSVYCIQALRTIVASSTDETGTTPKDSNSAAGAAWVSSLRLPEQQCCPELVNALALLAHTPGEGTHKLELAMQRSMIKHAMPVLRAQLKSLHSRNQHDMGPLSKHKVSCNVKVKPDPSPESNTERKDHIFAALRTLRMALMCLRREGLTRSCSFLPTAQSPGT